VAAKHVGRMITARFQRSAGSPGLTAVDQLDRLIVLDRGVDLADVIAVAIEQRRETIVWPIHDEFRGESQQLAIRQFYADEVRSYIVEAVIGRIVEITDEHELAPEIAHQLGAFETDGIDIERPAVTEVARTMITAVVGAGNRDRDTGQRQVEIFERGGEL